jgi:hypothetical protein
MSSSNSAGPANRQPDASPAGFRHALAKLACRAIFQHSVHGKQFQSHRASLPRAIARPAERQYLRRAAGLRHHPAGFTAATTAAGNRPGPSPSSSRRWGRRRSATQSNLVSTKLCFRGSAIQQSLERPNRLRHTAARLATIRIRRLPLRFHKRRHAILRGSWLSRRHRLISPSFAALPSGKSFAAIATAIVTFVALIRLDRHWS